MARRQRRSWGKIARQRSGRFQASYVGGDLARHTAPCTYTARMDAEHWLCDERRLIERDEWTPPRLRSAARHTRAKTLREYASEWLETRPLKPRTRFGYQDLFKGRIDPKLGAQVLGAISPETVRAWHAGLGTTTPRQNANAYSLLHAILATAVSDGHISSNPCAIRCEMNTPTRRQPVILDVDEIAKLANVIAPDRLKALVLVSAWCGLRFGEVTELRRRDISADASVITVARAVTHRNGHCFIDTPKSGKARQVYVPPHMRADLRDHLALFVANDPDALVFPAPRACHLSDQAFRIQLAEWTRGRVARRG